MRSIIKPSLQFIKANNNFRSLCTASIFYSKKHKRHVRNVYIPLPVKQSLVKPQLYKYFLIVDFEATCDKGFVNTESQEIIEFPVLKLNSETLQVESVFHELVRPRLNPELTPFCTKLTGIIQQNVEESPLFPEVVSMFNSWCEREVGSNKCLAVCCGEWDLMNMLPMQCAHDNMPVPECFRNWANLKHSYCSMGNSYARTLKGIFAGLGLETEGRPHSGVDDCHNISNAVCELIRRGLVVKPTKELNAGIP